MAHQGSEWRPHRRILLSALSLGLTGFMSFLLLSACVQAPLPRETRITYEEARDALEAGDYTTALRLYENVLTGLDDGPTQALISLEYAHGLLRADEPVRALAVAREIKIRASEPTASARAALVAAVAAHELTKRAVARTAPYQEVQARARSAFRSLADALLHYPQYDPHGVLALRMKKLRELLAELEIQQLHTEIETGTGGKRAAYILREFADTDAVADARALISRAQTEPPPQTWSPATKE